MEFLQKYWKYIVVLVIGMVLGALITYTCFPRTKIVEMVQAEVKTEVVLADHTEIGYVPKEVVNGKKESTDVEVKKPLPVVTVKVNDKVTDLPILQSESQKFDKGKIVLDQSTTLKVDITAQVEKQIADGIEKAFAKQAEKPKYRIGLEGTMDIEGKTEGNLRISRQAEAFDVDARVTKDKQSISATWWFK